MWKYGLIKIDYPDLWEDDEYCELVELYKDADGNYTSFSKARIKSFKELSSAYAEVLRDGVNTWFAENGKFDWDSESKFWTWTRDRK